VSEAVTPADRYRRVAAGFDARLAALGPGVWSAPVPTCPEWTVQDLVIHVVGVHHAVLGTVRPDESAPGTGDLVAAWRGQRDLVLGALADPELAGRTVGGAFGDQPFASLVGRVLCSDTVVHTWDLARAAGLDEHLDSEACAAALGFLEPLGEALRRPGAFGPAVAPAGDADGQTRLLNFTGRQV